MSVFNLEEIEVEVIEDLPTLFEALKNLEVLIEIWTEIRYCKRRCKFNSPRYKELEALYSQTKIKHIHIKKEIVKAFKNKISGAQKGEK